MKRFIAILLSVTLILSCGITASAASANSPYTTTLPTVYLEGANAPLATYNEDGTVKDVVYPLELGQDKIMQIVKENIGIFAKAFFTQKWDDFCVMLRDVMSDLMSEIRLDENGKAPNGSTVRRDWRRSGLPTKTVNGKYQIDQYKMHYDWRIDPYESADRLHRYIEDVLYVTKAPKVNLLSRCYGVCVAAAYMEKYGGEGVAEWIIYNSAASGATQCSKAFCGEIWLDGDGIERFAQDLTQIADDNLRALVGAFATMLGKTYGLDIAAWAVNNVYKDIYMQIVPPVLTETYGTFPSYWAMVSENDYEKAKSIVFSGEDSEKWDNFIRIIDNYHENVKVRLPELIQECRDKGIDVSNVVKYGFQSIPVTPDATLLSDGMAGVEESSMGATVSTLLDTLDDSYIQKATENGTDRYISPDKQIDASTCLLPEKTWFIKNLSHKNFPVSAEELMSIIFDTSDMTIDTDERFPQYIVYDTQTDKLIPMTAENCDTTARYRTTFWKALCTFWKSLFRWLWQQMTAKKAAA